MNNTSQVRPRQRDRLLALLKSRAPAWVPLPDILSLRIAQYNARFFELRRLGHRIESRQQAEHSWFRLVTSSAAKDNSTGRSVQAGSGDQESLLGDLAPEARYPE